MFLRYVLSILNYHALSAGYALNIMDLSLDKYLLLLLSSSYDRLVFQNYGSFYKVKKCYIVCVNQ